MNTETRTHLEEVRQTGQTICEALCSEITKLGLPDSISMPVLDDADYILSPDPMNGKNSLVGTWRNDKGQKTGEILFHADGSFYAEYDVVRPHPKKQNWFVEGVTAWGNDSVVKAEPKLLPVVG